MPRPDGFHVYDTTLRDGAQREGISYSVTDKLTVARLLDDYGVGFIEGGWPGAMPKDTEFFQRARTCRSSCTLTPALRVAPNATSSALRSVSSVRARWKNSVSLGMAPGHPPSMKPTP